MFWLVVADASSARIFATNAVLGYLHLHKELAHSASREKRQQLASDRPGHYKTPAAARGAYSGHTDPKEVEADRFARELANVLEKARAQQIYRKLILVMPAHFYGLLNKHLSETTRALIHQTLQKDYTFASEQELKKLLSS